MVQIARWRYKGTLNIAVSSNISILMQKKGELRGGAIGNGRPQAARPPLSAQPSFLGTLNAHFLTEPMNQKARNLGSGNLS